VAAVAALALVPAADAGAPALTWQQAAARLHAPVYRPSVTLGIKPQTLVINQGGCLIGAWGSAKTQKGPHFSIDEPGDTSQCGQPGEADEVSTVAIHGTRVHVLVQCGHIPHCTVHDGETDGVFIIFVPESGARHYVIQLNSSHVMLRDLVRVARSFVRVTAPRSPAALPVLGDANGGTAGFGQARPRVIALANDIITQIHGITWGNWGATQASGAGTGYWIPAGKPASDSQAAPAKIVAFDLGSCHGVRAYRKVEWWLPSRGGHFSAQNATPTCL
jgi:hypothetical protein